MQLLFLLILKLISHVNTLINIAKAVAKPTIVLYQVMMALLLWKVSSLPLPDNNNNTQKSTYKNDVYILKLKKIEEPRNNNNNQPEIYNNDQEQPNE